MIKINGVAIPAPTDYDAGIMDISKSERNAKGTLIMEIIATKRKLELFWEFISKTELQQVLTLVSRGFFTVEYPDPQTGNQKTGTFYAGDRNAKGLMYKDGQMYWKDLKFNVIER